MLGLSLITAHAVGVPALLMATLLNWSEPVKLREINSGAGIPQIASNSRGQAVAIWFEAYTVVVSTFTPGSNWSPPTVIAVVSGSSTLQELPAVVMGDDGTIIAAWRQEVSQGDSEQSQVAARRFVPGVGWEPEQLLSNFGGEVSLAMAPDGRAHAVFSEGISFAKLVAKTFGPGEEVWSQAVVLGDSPYEFGNLVAINGIAYAGFANNGAVELAMYTIENGWQPAFVVGAGDGPQLVVNAGHIALSWIEGYGLPTSVLRIQRLTEWGTNYTLPRSVCRATLLPNGTIIAVCIVQGDPVPGCFEPLHGGGQMQANYSYLEAYRLPLVGDRIDMDVISDYQQRVGGSIIKLGPMLPKVLADTLGEAFVVWGSDVPCQSGSQQTLTRVWSPDSASWQPTAASGIVELGTGASLTADGVGTLHALWGDYIVDFSQSPPVSSTTIFAAELPARASQSSQ